MFQTWSCRQTTATHHILHKLCCLIVGVVAINLYVIFRLTVLDDATHLCPESQPFADSSEDSSLQKHAIVIWDFEDFENDISETVRNLLPTKANVVIVSDHIPYPPLMLPKTDSVHLVTTDIHLSSSVAEARPEFYIATASYVFLAPDGVRIAGSLQRAVKFLIEVSDVDQTIAMVAFPVETANLTCLNLDVDAKRWTLEYRTTANDTVCDAVDGKEFVLLMSKETLLNLSSPFLRPFGSALFIQSAYRGLKVIIDKQKILSVHMTALYESSHNKWKHNEAENTRLYLLYEQLGFKLIKRSNDRQEWHGCSKETARCFGTVVNDMPEYIYHGRWTPPCCLRALRETARYVFQIFESEHVRYWLEGGSLLGAARTGDIIPWDYDVDVGIYQDDISLSTHLSYIGRFGYFVEGGFVWEKATEGEFYRVVYSESNRLHVDIFPFHSQNGTMTKNTWFKSHRQDTEFPESFLKPLEKISFVGVDVSVPNNIRSFLEFKFGKGVIENPRLPNAKAVT